MPSNTIEINGNIKYEVPDSWMPPLMAYLNLVRSKIEEQVEALKDIKNPKEE